MELKYLFFYFELHIIINMYKTQYVLIKFYINIDFIATMNYYLKYI